MKIPSGSSLLLTGSGLYWILASQLIASFSVLVPEVFRSDPQAVVMVVIVGIVSLVAGLWLIGTDLDGLAMLLCHRDGWLFALPILLAVCDIFLTLVGLAPGTQVEEVNPFAASAVRVGVVALVAFLVSYMALSEGLGLLMLDFGRRLFGEMGSKRFVPYAMVCGAASVGVFSNAVLLLSPGLARLGYVLGFSGSSLLAFMVYERLGVEAAVAAVDGKVHGGRF